MFITEEKLKELFYAFGISYSMENGNVKFVDVETNTPLIAFIYDRFGNKVEYNDPNIVFSGGRMLLDKGNKRYFFNIKNGSLINNDESEDCIDLMEIEFEEEIEPDIFKVCKFEPTLEPIGWDTDNSYEVVEQTRARNGKVFSYAHFAACDLVGKYPGNIMIRSNGNQSDIIVEENKDSGEITSYFRPEREAISEKDSIEMIDNSIMFKDLLGVFCPKLDEGYKVFKENNIGRSR